MNKLKSRYNRRETGIIGMEKRETQQYDSFSKIKSNKWMNRLKIDKTKEKLATLLKWRRDSNTFNHSTVVFSKFWGWSTEEARRSRGIEGLGFSKFWGWSTEEARRSRGREGSQNFGGEQRRRREEDLGFSEIFNLEHWN